MGAADLEHPGEEQGPEGRRGAGHRYVGIVGKPVTRGEIAGELEVDPGVVEGKSAEVDAAYDETLALKEEGERRGERDRGEEERAASSHRLSRTNV